jgi:hypothetical protein
MRRSKHDLTHRVRDLTVRASLLIAFVSGIVALGSCSGGSGGAATPAGESSPDNYGDLATQQRPRRRGIHAERGRFELCFGIHGAVARK